MNEKNIDLSKVPTSPGCYLWKDNNGEVIYVGKAKNLRNRMKQYFNLNQNLKTSMLVKHIVDYEYVIVASEIDALIVELNLINKYNPKYNIKLKETKTYPYLLLKKEPTLKLEVTKNIFKKKEGKYFGPFPEGFGPRKVQRLAESIYPIGKCLKPNSGVPCLNYQLGICPGYCLGKVSEEKINKIYFEVSKFLSGNITETIKKVETLIQDYSSKNMFEQAQEYFTKLNLVKNYKERQHSYFMDQKHRDFISFAYEDGYISIAISSVRFGNLINTFKILFQVHDLNYEDSFVQYIANYYQKNLVPHEIVLEKTYDLDKYIKTSFFIPKIGVKKEILNIAKEQAEIKLISEREELALKNKKVEKAINDFKEILKIKKLREIEMIDISHFQGKNQVGVVVNFNDFIPNKNLYRKYNLDDTNNDYAHIYEVTYRHFRKKLMNGQKMPDLYIVDGKAQMKFAQKAINELLIKNIGIIGLVKNNKHDTRAILTENLQEIDLSNRNDLYILLGYMQDEVHRFALISQQKKNERLVFN